MRTADQVRWDFFQEWLRKAESDFVALRILVGEDLEDYEVAASHARQAVDKRIRWHLAAASGTPTPAAEHAPTQQGEMMYGPGVLSRQFAIELGEIGDDRRL